MSGADRTIADATPENFVIQFLDDLQPGTYEVRVVFDIGCQLNDSFP